MRSTSSQNDFSKDSENKAIAIKNYVSEIIAKVIGCAFISLQIKQWRNTLFKLDLNTEEGRHKYQEIRFQFTVYNEGVRYEVYDDQNAQWKVNSGIPLKGKRTIGIGFNMDRPEAKEEWDNAFQITPNKPSYDEVLQGKNLTEQEVHTLFDYSIVSREKELTSIYKGIWESLKPNEKLALESIYYNGPSWVKPEGNKRIKLEENIFPTLQRYVQTKDPEVLKSVRHTIKNLCNPFNPDEKFLTYQIIKWRRYREAKFFGNRSKLERSL
jgi:GH24 family phage-related lysozyme (muramidase)